MIEASALALFPLTALAWLLLADRLGLIPNTMEVNHE